MHVKTVPATEIGEHEPGSGFEIKGQIGKFREYLMQFRSMLRNKNIAEQESIRVDIRADDQFRSPQRHAGAFPFTFRIMRIDDAVEGQSNIGILPGGRSGGGCRFGTEQESGRQ